MAIYAYTGLFGSGKSFEVVKSVIVPAIAARRRVVSNIDGLNQARIHDLVCRNRREFRKDLGKRRNFETYLTETPYLDTEKRVVWEDLKGKQLVNREQDNAPSRVVRIVKKTGKEVGESVRARVCALLVEKLFGREYELRYDSVPEAERRIVYCMAPKDASVLGTIVQVGNAEIEAPGFFPHAIQVRDDATNETRMSIEEGAFVQPGDLVAIDEAVKWFGAGFDLPKAHEVFLREHRHFVNEDGFTCDVALLTQSVTDFKRSVKVVIQFTFRMKKHTAVGVDNAYTVACFEGAAESRGRVSVQRKFYDKRYFPCYESYKGGKKAVEVRIDKRASMFASSQFKWALFGVPVLFVVCILLVSWLKDPSHMLPAGDAARRAEAQRVLAEKGIGGDPKSVADLPKDPRRDSSILPANASSLPSSVVSGVSQAAVGRVPVDEDDGGCRVVGLVRHGSMPYVMVKCPNSRVEYRGVEDETLTASRDGWPRLAYASPPRQTPNQSVPPSRAQPVRQASSVPPSPLPQPVLPR